jgi:hypothetical protein
MAVSLTSNAVLLQSVYYFKAHTLPIFVSFQHGPQHFAHISRTWKTCHFSLRSEEEQPQKYLEFVVPFIKCSRFWSTDSVFDQPPQSKVTCILWRPFFWCSKPNPSIWKMVVEPCTDRKLKLWWCSILHDAQFFIVVPSRNDRQHKIDNNILVALYLLSSHIVSH